MKRDFEKDFFDSLKSAQFTANDFNDIEKIENFVSEFSQSIEIVADAICSDNSNEEIEKLVKENKHSSIIMLLSAIRQNNKVNFLDSENKELSFHINAKTEEDKKNLLKYTKNSKTYSFLRNNIKREFFLGYVYGILFGLDSNSRKNRAGALMHERCYDLVVSNLEKNSSIYNVKKELSTDEIKNFCGIDINWSGSKHARKRFDIAIWTKGHLFLLEVNFYSTSGSKLNETARSYISLNNDIKKLGFDNVHFIWVTDGIGWKSTKNGIEEAFNNIEHLYNLTNLENGALTDLINSLPSKHD